jgi:electron transport complex protein RnfA
VNSPLAILALLAVFSGLSMNLILHCGLGLRGITTSESSHKDSLLIQLGIVFVTVLALWLVFSCITTAFSWGFFEYILLFPAASLAYFGLEYLLFRTVLKQRKKRQGPLFFCDGLAGAALYITLNIAGGFFEAAALSFGFVLGILLAFVIIGEIRRRAVLEAVPRFLRGSPLALISMGLLSLIFSSAALLFFRSLGG